MRFAYGNGDQPLTGYTIKRGVGIGGFGEVYFATNDAGKEVALKRIQRNLDVEVRGVRQCINLRHPNLVGLYDIRFDDSGQGWIVMEFVAGESLRDLLDHRPSGLSVDETLQWFGQLAAGVTYLHDQGIVHRDLKPANIFIDGGLVKIGDYGLSKFISCSRRGGQTESVGTFHYMAPEIGKGEYGKEIDIYALGIILYEMLTGNVPFDGESGQEIILKHLTADPDVSCLSQPFASVVAKALAKNPASRYRDVREMLEPIGLFIDSAGLATRNASVAMPAQPVVQRDRNSPPILTPVDHPAGSPEMVFGPVVRKKAGANFRGQKFASVDNEGATTLTYNEPIARAVQASYQSVQKWWNELPMAGPARGVVVTVAILLLIFNSSWIIATLLTGLMMYVPYYVIWYMITGGQASQAQKNPSKPTPMQNPGRSPAPPVMQPLAQQATAAYRPVAAPVPPKPVVPKPIPFRQWQLAQRKILAHKPVSKRLHEVSGSMLSSTFTMGVLAVVGGLVALGTNTFDQPGLVAVSVWTGAMALLGSWTILLLGKKWESQEEDKAIFRFKQLAAGLIVGAIAYSLSSFLMVPWDLVSPPDRLMAEAGSEIVEPAFDTDFIRIDLDEDFPSARRWNGFYAENGAPLLPAFISYFALLFGGLRWWRAADIVRKSRFSYGSVFMAVLIAAFIQILVPFPQPWGMILAGSMAVAIQMSARWIDSSERLRPEPAAEAKIA